MSKYILYARKSTESEDRQVLSIGAQIKDLKAIARSEGLNIVSILTESKSAKKPGRPIFNQMVKRLARKEVDGILAWKLDRLARNPIDGAKLVWALEEGYIRAIRTRDREFQNCADDKFFMTLDFGIAKKYVDDLSDHVRKGLDAKLALGWLPGLPPLGYKNDRETRTIIPDPDRFPLVRRIWDRVLQGHSPIAMLSTINNDWGLRTRVMGKLGGRPIHRSTLYKLLDNPFYYGLLVRKGETYPGAHKAMITKDEFDRVQEILGRPNRAPQKKHNFAFTGLIRCGECGLMVTAEQQINAYGRRYVYYHCSKRRTDYRCSQKNLRKERIEDQVIEFLDGITLNKEFRDWALEKLTKIYKDDAAKTKNASMSLERTHSNVKQEVKTLLEVRLRGLISDHEFIEKKRALTDQEVKLRRKIQDSNDQASQWFELSQKALFFANRASKHFKKGSDQEKREILISLGSNFTLKNRKLLIQARKPFELMAERPSSSSICGLVDGLRTFFQEHPDAIQWPRFCSEAI